MMMTIGVRYQLKQLINETAEKSSGLTGIKPESFQVVLLSTAYVNIFNCEGHHDLFMLETIDVNCGIDDSTRERVRSSERV